MKQHTLSSSQSVRCHGSFDDGLEEPIRTLEPEFADAFRAMQTAAIRRGALEPWVRELIGLAIYAAVNTLYGPGISRHLKAALDTGATPAQVLQTLELTSVLGIHTITVALPIVLEELGIEASDEFDAEQEQLKADFISRRGSWTPLWNSLLQVDREFFRAYTAFSSVPWSQQEGSLSPKVREFIYVAIDASTNHLMVPGIRAHVANAIRYRATLDELLEVLEITSLAGIHSFIEGAQAYLSLSRDPDGASEA
jgi:alkylhydroperoxidase/carboxymuconolactone decarboxylase family protein YurZ